MSTARPLAVTVLSPSGEVLGVWTTKPSNSNWRMTGGGPRITGVLAARECERYGEGWAVRLREGEKAPRSMRRR